MEVNPRERKICEEKNLRLLNSGERGEKIPLGYLRLEKLLHVGFDFALVFSRAVRGFQTFHTFSIFSLELEVPCPSGNGKDDEQVPGIHPKNPPGSHGMAGKGIEGIPWNYGIGAFPVSKLGIFWEKWELSLLMG